MARQEVSRTTHIEEGELRVTHENAILTNITVLNLKSFFIFNLCSNFQIERTLHTFGTSAQANDFFKRFKRSCENLKQATQLLFAFH